MTNNIFLYIIISSLWGRVELPTGGKVRKRKPTRCNSVTDGTVRMKKDRNTYCILPQAYAWDFCFFEVIDMQSKSRQNIMYLTRIAILGAVAAVLMLFEFPVPFLAPSFYEFDFSEIPVLIGTFALGPVAGVLIELIKVLINLLITGTSTAFVGELANFVMGCSFILPAGFIYKYHKSKSGALVSMLTGTSVLAASSYFINAFLMIPFYISFLPIPEQTIIDMAHDIMPMVNSISEVAFYCVVPFNLFKGVVISVITFILYKHIHKLLKKIK